MLTELYFETFGQTIRIANLFSYPLTWNAKTKRLQFSRSLHANVIIAHFLTCSLALYIIGQMINYKKNGKSSELSLLLPVSYSGVAMSLGFMLMTFQPKEVECLWNSSHLYGSKFYGMEVNDCGNSEIIS